MPAPFPPELRELVRDFVGECREAGRCLSAVAGSPACPPRLPREDLPTTEAELRERLRHEDH